MALREPQKLNKIPLCMSKSDEVRKNSNNYSQITLIDANIFLSKRCPVSIISVVFTVSVTAFSRRIYIFGRWNWNFSACEKRKNKLIKDPKIFQPKKKKKKCANKIQQWKKRDETKLHISSSIKANELIKKRNSRVPKPSEKETREFMQKQERKIWRSRFSHIYARNLKRKKLIKRIINIKSRL